jgi:hypothetical protein
MEGNSRITLLHSDDGANAEPLSFWPDALFFALVWTFSATGLLIGYTALSAPDEPNHWFFSTAKVLLSGTSALGFAGLTVCAKRWLQGMRRRLEPGEIWLVASGCSDLLYIPILFAVEALNRQGDHRFDQAIAVPYAAFAVLFGICASRTSSGAWKTLFNARVLFSALATAYFARWLPNANANVYEGLQTIKFILFFLTGIPITWQDVCRRRDLTWLHWMGLADVWLGILYNGLWVAWRSGLLGV